MPQRRMFMDAINPPATFIDTSGQGVAKAVAIPAHGGQSPVPSMAAPPTSDVAIICLDDKKIREEIKRLEEALRNEKNLIDYVRASRSENAQYVENYCRQSKMSCGVGAAVAIGALMVGAMPAIITLSSIVAGLGAVAYCGTKISAHFKEKKFDAEIGRYNARIGELEREKGTWDKEVHRGEIKEMIEAVSGEKGERTEEEDEFIVIDGIKLAKQNHAHMPGSLLKGLRKKFSDSY
jgi:hypothetical protein